MTLLFIIALGDALMSYTTPIFLEENLNNTLFMGIVFSTSSLVGFIFDIYAGAYLKNKTHNFFLISTAIVAISFPAILIFLPKHVFFYILAMAMWGIYYEARSFSQFTYIKNWIPKPSYSFAWGAIQNIGSLAYLLGPILASYLLMRTTETPLYFALALFSLGFLCTLMIMRNLDKSVHHKEVLGDNVSLIKELRVWKVLSGRLWMIWIVWFLLWCVDAAFWSVGILLAENLKEVSTYGWYFIPLYMLPKTFTGSFVPKLSQVSGKKYLTFVTAIVGGVALIFLGIGTNIYTLLLFNFISSAAISLAMTAMSATFEDYISRVGKYGPELIGLEQTASSLGYIIAPIGMAAIATVLTDQLAFAVLGGIITLVSGLALLIVPRKVKMPQERLNSL